MKTAWFSFLLFGESNTERFHYRSDTQSTKETDLEQTSIHKCKDFSESEAKLQTLNFSRFTVSKYAHWHRCIHFTFRFFIQHIIHIMSDTF